VECYRCNIPVQNYDEFLETYGVREADRKRMLGHSFGSVSV
jgi:predicted metalloendopeptidase